MSNPTINRLGQTQIWYKNYYSDFSYSEFYKTITTFEKLLNIYFNYGLYLQNNLLFSNFWYKNYKPHVNKSNSFFQKYHTSLYFRKYYYTNKTLAIEHSYFLRLKTPEFFPLRLYIMSYNNWIIASIQWFKPSKNSSTIKSTKIGKNIINTIITNNLPSTSQITRLKLISYLIKSRTKFAVL